jgi:predicted O-linked N-acetylglucosamine transferase (SPINDLY family)
MTPAPFQKTVPFNVPQTLAQAIEFHHQGRLAEADRLYAAVLASRPDNFDALQMRGLIKLSNGEHAEALRLVAAAMKLRPTSPQVLLNHGLVLNALDRHEEALASFDLALRRKAKYAEAHNNRGAALAALGRDEEALASYQRALVLKPQYPEALANMAGVLKSLGRHDEALASVERAIALKPNYAKAHNQRGTILDALKRPTEAMASYDAALALDPRSAEPLNNRAVVLRGLNRHDEALDSLDKALAVNPFYAQALYNRGALLSDLNRPRDAVASYNAAVNAKPDFAEARLAAAIAELPVIYSTEAEIDERRAAYHERLSALTGDYEAGHGGGDWSKAVGPNQPFYLAYQGRNDRELQSLYGALACRIMASRYAQPPMAPPPAPGEPIRVGIVSGFFYEHSNWKIPIKGWLSQLDRDKFRLYGYHTGIKTDGETAYAASLCTRFVHGARTLDAWRDAIIADAPHVLIYPEVGMDAVSVRLAAQRLAPVQCNSWGHPDTSGFPTLDYYFSSDLMEPPQAQEHYSEALVRLPNLSIYYEPPVNAPVAISRAELGLREGVTAFWCGQSIYKYLPQYDEIFARIAHEAGDCQFVFLAHQGAKAVTDIFQARLETAFATYGRKAAAHCVILPRLSRERFAAAIGQCDVVLDSIGWSGCNSTLESLALNLPVVTLPGEFMRGRHSAAILHMMDVTETIAENADGYVAIAARLAQDTAWREAIGAKFAANKEKLSRDRDCIVALEDFLERAARQVMASAATPSP